MDGTLIDRRLKILRADPRLIVEMLNGLPSQSIGLPTEALGLPEGTQVVEVDRCFWTRSLKLVLRHPSFPEVPEGQELPMIAQYVPLTVFKRRPVADTHCEETPSLIEFAALQLSADISAHEMKTLKETLRLPENAFFEDVIARVRDLRTPFQPIGVALSDSIPQADGTQEVQVELFRGSQEAAQNECFIELPSLPCEQALEPAQESWRDRPSLL